MSFAGAAHGGGKMRWGSGYRDKKEPAEGGKPEAMPHEGDPQDGGHEGQIHEHLQAMHAATGKAHSHVEHHGDGTHSAHHVSAEGQMQGPEESGDCPGGMCGGGDGEGGMV